jgi:outer membrane protein assembly factor BamB
MRPCVALRFGFLCVLSLGWAANRSAAADWIHWRGPEQNGTSPERDLPDKWSPDKAGENNLIWKQPYGCRSTPLVINNRVYIIDDTSTSNLTEQERVMCFDADTGKVIWEHKFNVFHTGIVSNRLGWTNLSADKETGNVYAHGTQGLLFCFDGKTGKVIWSHSLTEEYGRVSGYGGRLCSPVCDGDLVIIGMINSSWGDQARGANRFAAFDKKTGQVAWWTQIPGDIRGTKSYYSTPVIAVINGQRLFITGAADGSIHALKVRTGELVWSYDFCNDVINSSPVVSPDGKVYCSHGEENEGSNVQGRIICVDATKVKDKQPELVWKKDGIKASYASPILHDGKLYIVSNEARLYCFDAQKGEELWKRPFPFGRLSRGSPLWADDKIYVFDVNAHFHILKPGATKCDELHDQFFASTDGKGFVECNGTPAAVNGKIYLATRSEIYCIGKKDHKTPPDKVAGLAPEKAAASTPAVLRLFPGDVVVAPGESVTFKVRAYDANGQELKDVAKAEWTLPTPPLPPKATTSPPPLAGEVADGKLTVAKDRPFQQGYVQAKAGTLTALARVRVVPPLPIKTDFSKVKGTSPSGWVNCAGKFVMEDLKDGSRVLKKTALQNAPAPLARANTYFGLPTWTDYTIQADVLGKEVQDNMPDIGVVANRYTLVLDGKRDPADSKRRLHIHSWDALPRIDHSIAFDWKPNVWYRMKFTVDVQKDKALVRGKVWPADQKEPEAWTIEFEDPVPNREGAPALYGYAPGIVAGTEALYNNVSVTPNKKGN